MLLHLVSALSVALVALYFYLNKTVDFRRRYKGCEYAVVTGATGGIGKVLTKELLKQVHVIALGRSQQLLDDLVAQCAGAAHAVVPFLFDFKGDLAQFQPQFDAFLQRSGIAKEKIGACYSNVGYGDYCFFHEQTFAEKLAFFQVNIQSHVLMADYFVKLFLEARAGKKSAFVLTASAESYIVGHKVATYHVSKKAVHGLGSALYAEYSPRGVDVLTVHPTAVSGNILRQFAKKVGNKSEFKAVAVTEEQVVRQLVSRPGKMVHSDVGLSCDAVNLGARLLGDNLLAVVHRLVGGGAK